MLVIHKSCRSFDLGEDYGRQDLAYEIQRAIDDGLQSLLLARDVLLKDDAHEQHEFLAMFGKQENYDGVLVRIKSMLEVYQSKKIRINITCGNDWIAEVWDQRKSRNEFTGKHVDMTVPHWRNRRGSDARPQAKLPYWVIKSCHGAHDIAFAWWTGSRAQHGIVLKRRAFGVDKANLNPELIIGEIGVQDGTQLHKLDCLTTTILHEVSHLIHLFGRKGSSVDLETDDIFLDPDMLDEFDAERDSVSIPQLRTLSAPAWYLRHNSSAHAHNAGNCLDSAFDALSLGVDHTGHKAGGNTSTFGGDEQEDEDEDEEEDDLNSDPNSGRCYGPRLCGFLARSYQSHDAPRNADSIAYFILMLRFRERGWWFDEKTWTAEAVDDYSASEGSCGESDADDTGSEDEEGYEEQERYDSKDNKGAMYSEDESEDEYEKIY